MTRAACLPLSVFRRRPWIWIVAAILVPSFARAVTGADKLSTEDIELFEKHIRPVLAKQCFECHSESIQAKGGLRLDIALGLRLGGQRGESIVPGEPDQSLLIQALKQTGQLKMPPGDKLSDEEIGYFEEWVRRGAPDPRETAAEPPFDPRKIDWADEGSHWAYQQPRLYPPPVVADATWPRTDIDRFVLSQLEAKSLKPAADADPATWLRRVYLDLIGIPPTPGETLDYELDSSSQAKEKAVDHLLSLPQFGERWGRHWLDVARYGESTGKERNFVYLQAWRYRDYVIDSFNADKPYDQFLREQVAGDLLPYENDLQRDLNQIATGFLALNPKGINDRNRESFLLEIVDEQIESVTRGVMGLSVVCARCHDHKYDPISQADYYAIGGILRSSEPKFGIVNRTRYASVPEHLLALQSKELTNGERPPAELADELKNRTEALQRKTAEARRRRDKLPAKKTPTTAVVASADVKQVIGSDGAATTQSTASEQPDSQKSAEELALKSIEDEIDKETKELERLRAKVNENVAHTMAIGLTERERSSDLAIRVRGEVDKLGEVVPRGFLTVLRTAGTPRVNTHQSGRLELANWLSSPANPLTARVYINRVWSKLLGTGIVATVDNFGVQGEKPTHPELLDYLTVRFVEQNWSTKQLIRAIVLSRVYGLSGQASDSKNVEADLDNKLLWRWNRKRLDAEVLRDTVLSISGNLDLSRPNGTPLVELGTRELGPQADYAVVNRPYRYRSVYLPLLRGRAPEMMVVFDVADPSLTVGKRDVTSGPDQALYILNSPIALEESKLLARRLLSANVSDDAARVDLAFRLTFGTAPTFAQREASLKSIADFIRLNQTAAHTAPDAAAAADQSEQLDGTVAAAAAAGSTEPSKTALETDDAKLRELAWANFAQTLLALPEFRYVF